MFDLVGRDETFGLLEATMDLTSVRQSLIASNIANVDTPGYKARDIAFRKELQIALERTDSGDRPLGSAGRFSYKLLLKPRIFKVTGVTPRQDGNTVDIDNELGKLAKTQSIFSQASKLYGLKLKMLKAAIRGD